MAYLIERLVCLLFCNILTLFISDSLCGHWSCCVLSGEDKPLKVEDVFTPKKNKKRKLERKDEMQNLYLKVKYLSNKK